MTGETKRSSSTRPPRAGLYRPRRYATGRSTTPEPATLDASRSVGDAAPVASFVLILSWLVVWSIDLRNPAPAFAGVVFAFVVVVIFPLERVPFAVLGRRFILLSAALTLPITYVLLRARGVDSILDTPLVLVLILLLTPAVLVSVHTRERGTAPIPLLTVALTLALPAAVIGYGFVEQRFIRSEHESRIIDNPSINKVFGFQSTGGGIESFTSEANEHPASLVVDSVADGSTRAWRSLNSDLPQAITIRLNPPRALERIVLYNASDEPRDTWPRLVEVAIGPESKTPSWIHRQQLPPEIENVIYLPNDVATTITVRITETFGRGAYTSLAEILPIAR